jgi:RNA polymerase sigma-70 factor, ECF subfamily
VVKVVTAPFAAATVTSVATSDEIAATDVYLLQACVQGDRDAFATLYRRHAPWLFLRLSRRCADAGQVDEVVQDTFLAVWRGCSRFDGRGDVAAWIWGIATRRLVDAVRRRPRPTSSLQELPEAAAARATSAEDEVLVGLQYGTAGAALSRLSPDLRAVVQATVIDGLSTRDASRLLGIPAGTVKTRMMRARAALRKELG